MEEFRMHQNIIEPNFVDTWEHTNMEKRLA